MVTRTLGVFISSKQVELDDERQIAKEVVESFGFEPIMSENRPASPNSPLSVCLEEVEHSDIYLGIFYKEYSGPTEAEYLKATELDIPCLIFMKKLREDEHRDNSLNTLLREIRHPTKGRWTNDFEHVIELKGKIRTSLVRLLVSRFRS
ncbi:MAG: DUF4062 domain-containing protein [Candidatus Bathyarchaeia archaeon]|jgi:hypothetical protein